MKGKKFGATEMKEENWRREYLHHALFSSRRYQTTLELQKCM